jgi:hypothetical protein
MGEDDDGGGGKLGPEEKLIEASDGSNAESKTAAMGSLVPQDSFVTVFGQQRKLYSPSVLEHAPCWQAFTRFADTFQPRGCKGPKDTRCNHCSGYYRYRGTSANQSTGKAWAHLKKHHRTLYDQLW